MNILYYVVRYETKRNSIRAERIIFFILTVLLRLHNVLTASVEPKLNINSLFTSIGGRTYICMNNAKLEWMELVIWKFFNEKVARFCFPSSQIQAFCFYHRQVSCNNISVFAFLQCFPRKLTSDTELRPEMWMLLKIYSFQMQMHTGFRMHLYII